MLVLEFIGVVVGVSLTVPLALALGRRLVMGQNGYSLSKLQLLLWTVYIGISYLVYLWKLWREPGANFEIAASQNLLVLMGISAGSYLAASGIRAYQEQKGQVVARPDGARLKWVTLISDNSGNLDLSKVQMLGWTVIALCSYVVELGHRLADFDYGQPALPNVSDMLVALMGISQAAYIGRKAVPEPPPTAEPAPTPNQGASDANHPDHP